MEDHDQRFKQMLEAYLQEFIKLFFPQWANRFDWSQVEFLNREAFTDPPLGSRMFLDLIAKVHLHEPFSVSLRSVEHFVILIHIEIESGDSVAAFHPRMLDYFSWARTKHQVPILPIGLFLRVGLEGIGWIVYEESLWGEKLIQFRYPYIGLPALPALEYLERENLIAVALSALMKVPESERLRLKAEALHRIATGAGEAGKRKLLFDCVEAYLELGAADTAEFDQLLLTPRYREVFDMTKTSYEKGQEAGQQIGQRIGQEIGQRIGQEIGQRIGQEIGQQNAQMDMLKRMLPKRFGPLDNAIWKRVEAMSSEQRAQLAEDLVTATSLEQLGL